MTMTNNDILRRLRYALNLNGTVLSDILAVAGVELGPVDVLKLLKKEDENGFVACDDALLSSFLDGLIIDKRGPRETGAGHTAAPAGILINNLILRKLRIALELTDADMLGIFSRAGVTLSKPELSALFRAEGHRNYKECGDQLLRNFVRGLTLGEKL
jgi:uncharacterized protein YehS (DUF1456 family)